MKRKLCVLLAAVLAAASLSGCQPQDVSTAIQQKKPLLYIKNGSLYSMGLDNKPDRIVGQFPSQTAGDDSSPVWRADIGLVTSPSCKYLAYSTQGEGNGGFRTLYVASTEQNDVRVITSEIPSGLLQQSGPDLRRYYCFSDREDKLYFLQYDAQALRTDLYAWQDGTLTLVKENVTEFYFDKNEEKILCVGPTLNKLETSTVSLDYRTLLQEKYNYDIKQLSILDLSSGQETILSRRFVEEMDIADADGLTKINFVEEDLNGDRTYKTYEEGKGVYQNSLDESSYKTDEEYKSLLTLDDGSYIGSDDDGYYFVPADGEAQLLFLKTQTVEGQEATVSARFLLSEDQGTLYFTKTYSVADQYGYTGELLSAQVADGQVKDIFTVDKGNNIDFSPAAGNQGLFYTKQQRNEYNEEVYYAYYQESRKSAPAFLGADFNIYSSIQAGGELYIARRADDHLDYYNIHGTTPVLYQDQVVEVLVCNNHLYVLKSAGDNRYDIYLASQRVVLDAEEVIDALKTGCHDYMDIFAGL